MSRPAMELADRSDNFAHSTSSDTSLLSMESALREVPRETFLPGRSSTGRTSETSTVLPGHSVAALITALDPRPGERILHVGTGSGYVPAVLSRMVGVVHSTERIHSTAQSARERLARLGYNEVEVHHANGWHGLPGHPPFDAILVTARTGEFPAQLAAQLRVGGRMVISMGKQRQRQELLRIVRVHEFEFRHESLGDLNFTSELGDIMLEMGLIDASMMAELQATAERTGLPIDDELLRRTGVEERDVYRGLASLHGLTFAEIGELPAEVDASLLHGVPRGFLQHNRMIPVSKRANEVIVASCNPKAPLADLAKAFRRNEMTSYLVTPTDYRRLWARADLRSTERDTDLAAGVSPSDDLLPPREIDVEQHVTSLFETIMLEAIGEGASDIHLERDRDRARVRLRIDGELRELPRIELSPLDLIGLVNVIKVRARLDIAEKRLPQGGRMQLRLGGRAYDLRVQTQPCLHGEQVVMRVLSGESKLVSVDELGLPKPVARQYERLLASPGGLILVAGPTGSGKTTTLYAGLRSLAADVSRKIITIEDPIEYALDGVQQTQIRPDIGFAFDRAVRVLVRQDPDVILVGEIRDEETALEAIRASQTGHLVLSTVHSNDAVDAIQRLFDLGLHPNSIASELLAVVAQRLAKRICRHCKIRVEADPEILAELFPDGPPSDFQCHAGTGCHRCGGHGTRGRIAVAEFLRANPAVRKAISHHGPVDELRQTALDAGLMTMRSSALELVQSGIIPLSELPKLLSAERMRPEPSRCHELTVPWEYPPAPHIHPGTAMHRTSPCETTDRFRSGTAQLTRISRCEQTSECPESSSVQSPRIPASS